MDIRTRGVDPLPLWKTAARKLKTFLTVSQPKRETPLSQAEFLENANRIQRLTTEANDFKGRTAALWKLESLGFSLIRYSQPGNTLNDMQLAAEAKPITHVGLGAGAVEVGKFVPERITELIESYVDPAFRLFPYESLGAMLAMHEPRKFAVDRLILGLKPLHPPPAQDFLGHYPPEVQRLISHGYGRILYFKNTHIGSAVKAALGKPFLQTAAAAQGIAFAYMMVNNKDLYRVLEAGTGFEHPEVERSFTNGLIFALEFWEWVCPGCLDSLRPSSDRQSKLIEAAKTEVTDQRVRGWLEPFAVLGDYV